MWRTVPLSLLIFVTMDLSIVAAIGSFVISERMLRPKLLVMVGLGLLLILDLATHSNDPASLRIFRGEALVVRYRYGSFQHVAQIIARRSGSWV